MRGRINVRGRPRYIIVNGDSTIKMEEIIILSQTTDEIIQFALQDADGVAINITGYAFQFTGKSTLAEATNLFDVAGTITSASTGQFQVTVLSTTITTALKNGWCELVWFSDGIITNPADGRKRYNLIINDKVR